MGYDHHGALLGDPRERLPQRELVRGVELGGYLVEQQRPGPEEEHAGDGDTLALAPESMTPPPPTSVSSPRESRSTKGRKLARSRTSSYSSSDAPG